MHLAYLPNPDGVRLRISAIVPKESINQSDLEALIDKRFDALKELLGDAYMGLEYQSLEEAIANHLKSEKQTVSTAELCTAGGISSVLCRIPGASAFPT
jgi:nicotinamide-nucleotide amidase